MPAMLENPYPGLRPFRRDEAHLFFGRDEQSDHLLDKLAENRFIAVTGLSGSGKSSLVQAGLLPNLEFGYLAEAGVNWEILTMRPENAPIQNLAQTMIDAGLFSQDLPGSQKPAGREAISSAQALAQRLSAGGHLEFVRILQASLLSGKRRSFLLVIDQFEELFRYEKQSRLEERKFFVELLLISAQQQDVPVYVVITIRSDALGQCAQFRGLPEVINAGQFLTPRLTQEQIRQAITAPMQVVGGNIDDQLVLQLLQDVEYNQDQLPILQHCLMRMWTLKATNANDFSQVCLTLDDYNDKRVDGLANALSNHADEAYAELDERQQRIAERMFRCLTEGDLRRPARIQEIAAVADAPVADVVTVANVFRPTDRCFLSPYGETPLKPEKVIDISHESLIRQWKRLSGWEDATGWNDGWADQEKESAETYKRLEKTARLWQDNKAGLWGNPDLAIALNWQTEEQPAPEWAKRYESEDGNFELAIKFLNDSRLAQERKQRQEEEAREEKRRQQERVKHARQLLAVALLGLVIAVILAVWGFRERSVAEEARLKAIDALQREKDALLQAKDAYLLSETSAEKAEDARKMAVSALEDVKLTSARFREMVTATFGFLSESRQQADFLEWVQGTLTIERLIPALSVMIDSSERFDKEQRIYWKNTLPTMNESQMVVLLDTLGRDIAEKAKSKAIFRIRVEREREEAEKARKIAEEQLEKAELTTARFREMTTATFGFLSESTQNEDFLKWIETTFTIEQFIPALNLMIDSSKELDEEGRTYWKDQLPTMKEREMIGLLDTLGTEAAEKWREGAEKARIRIRQVTIKDVKNAPIPLNNGVCFIKASEKVIFEIDIDNPSNQSLKIALSAEQGQIETDTTYIAPNIPAGTTDIITIKVIDNDSNREVAQEPIIIQIIE